MSAAEEDQDLVDYDEEEEEQNVAAEETADAEGKETKKWVYIQKKNTQKQCHHLPCQKAMRWGDMRRHLLRQEGLPNCFNQAILSAQTCLKMYMSIPPPKKYPQDVHKIINQPQHGCQYTLN